MHFSHQLSDEQRGTELFAVDSIPQCAVKFRIAVTTPKVTGEATFKLARYRVRALVHSLQEWLDETEGQDE